MLKIEYNFTISKKIKKHANQNKRHLKLNEKKIKKLNSLKNFYISIYYAARNSSGNGELLSSLVTNSMVATDLLGDIMHEGWECDYLSDSFIKSFSNGVVPSCDFMFDLNKVD